MERNAHFQRLQSGTHGGQPTIRSGLQLNTVSELQKVLLLCDATIQNRLLAKYLQDYGICRAHLAAPSQLNAMMQCENPALVLLDIRSNDRCVADILGNGREQNQRLRTATPMILINVPAGVEMSQFLTRKDIVAGFHDNEPVEQLLSKIRSLLHPEQSRGRRHGEIPSEALTRKEMAVLRALALGLSNDHIADQLSVSPHTVKTHLYNAYRKIGCTNRVAAAMWAQRTLQNAELG